MSKQVIGDGKTAAAVIEAIRTNAAVIASRRAAQYEAAGVKGAPAADEIEAGLRCDAAMLELRCEALKEKDAALAKELGDDAEVAQRRDLYAVQVRGALVELRQSVQVNCGDAALASVGFAGDTPRDPAALEDLGGKVIENVAKKPPKSVKKGVKFDAKAAIEGLDLSVAGLAKANADVLREKREEQLARAHRDEAWAAFDRELSSAAGALDAKLRAVGLDDVADRLMPAARKAPAAPANGAPLTNGAPATP